MNELSFTFSVNIYDYHRAVYFAFVNRSRSLLRIFALVGVIALFNWGAGALGLLPVFMLPAYIFLGYLVWVLVLLGIEEYRVLQYAKSPQSILDHPTTLRFVRDTLEVQTHTGDRATHRLGDLFCAFEISELFLIYLNGAQSLMLPHRVMTPQQRAAVREKLQDALHGRFSTRFGYTSVLPQKSPLRKNRFF